MFLLEGPQAVREALLERPDLIVELFATPTAFVKHPDLEELSDAEGIEYTYASESVLDAMADTVTPQGVVAVARQFPTAVKDVLVAGANLIVICEEVRDPGNLGTIIRAADAVGADGVVLTGRTVDVYNAKVVRSTTGSLFHIPVAIGGDLDDVLVKARAAELQVLAADIKGGDLLDARREGVLGAPTAWLFGNEARGLEDDALDAADRVLRLPIYGRAESLNLATAASVCLYESAFSQRAGA